MADDNPTKTILDECWEWRGARNTRGYGRKRIRGKNHGLHRLAWAWANGPIPPGMFVLHRCDNPPCVNPKHLFLGSHLDNMKDRAVKGRDRNSKKTECLNGHPFTGSNLLVLKLADGEERACRECRRLRHIILARERLLARRARKQLVGPLPAAPNEAGK